jgi:hypothetical protein
MENTTGLPIFSVQNAPVTTGARWFVRQGGKNGQVELGKGFASKKQASEWINDFGGKLDWRAGFVFRLKGDTVDSEIVDRAGKRATV